MQNTGRMLSALVATVLFFLAAIEEAKCSAGAAAFTVPSSSSMTTRGTSVAARPRGGRPLFFLPLQQQPAPVMTMGEDAFSTALWSKADSKKKSRKKKMRGQRGERSLTFGGGGTVQLQKNGRHEERNGSVDATSFAPSVDRVEHGLDAVKDKTNADELMRRQMMEYRFRMEDRKQRTTVDTAAQRVETMVHEEAERDEAEQASSATTKEETPAGESLSATEEASSPVDSPNFQRKLMEYRFQMEAKQRVSTLAPKTLTAVVEDNEADVGETVKIGAVPTTREEALSGEKVFQTEKRDGTNKPVETVVAALRRALSSSNELADRLSSSDVIRAAREKTRSALMDVAEDEKLFSLDVQHGVPASTVKGAALAAAVLSTAVGNDLGVTVAIVPVAAYIAICQGKTGDVARQVGEGTWNFAVASTEKAVELWNNGELGVTVKSVWNENAAGSWNKAKSIVSSGLAFLSDMKEKQAARLEQLQEEVTRREEGASRVEPMTEEGKFVPYFLIEAEQVFAEIESPEESTPAIVDQKTEAQRKLMEYRFQLEAQKRAMKESPELIAEMEAMHLAELDEEEKVLDEPIASASAFSVDRNVEARRKLMKYRFQLEAKQRRTENVDSPLQTVTERSGTMQAPPGSKFRPFRQNIANVGFQPSKTKPHPQAIKNSGGFDVPLFVDDTVKQTMKPLPGREQGKEARAQRTAISNADAADLKRQLEDLQALLDAKARRQTKVTSREID